MAEKNLQELMDFIGAHWKFTSENYTGFSELSGHHKALFPLKHSILHINKSVGYLSTEAEKADHGDEADTRKLEIATAKLLATTLNLAKHLGMSAEQLEDMVRQAVEGKLSNR